MIKYSEMISALAADYLNVYIVEPEKDLGTIVKLNGKIDEDFEKSPKTYVYQKKLETYASTHVAEEDRAAFLGVFRLSSLLESFKGGKEKLEFSYRVDTEKRIRHFTGLYIRVSSLDEPLRIVAGFRNVDDILYTESKKESEGALKAYKTMSDIYLCMHRVDLKTDLYETIKTVPALAKVTQSSRFSENVEAVVDGLAAEESKPSAREFLNSKTLEERMKGKSHIALRFQGKRVGSCRLHFIKEDEDEEGRLSHVLFAVELLDEDKYQSVFDVLAEDFTNVFYFSVETGQGKIMKMGPTLAKASPKKDFDYERLLEEYTALFVVDEEKESIKKKLELGHLRELFAREDSYAGNFNILLNGKRHAYSYDFRKMKEHGYLVCGFRCVDSILEEHIQEEKRKREKEEAYQSEIKESYRKLTEMQSILKASKMGTWRITLIEGKAPTMEGDDLMKELLGVGGKTLTPEELYNAWYNQITPKALPSVLSSVAKMESEGFDENTYLWRHPALGERYVRCGGTAYQVLGGYVLRGYHYDVDDVVRASQEKEKKLARATALEKSHASVINAVAKIYTTIFRASVKTHEYEIINSVPLMLKVASRTGSFDEVKETILASFMAEDCKEEMSSFLDLDTMEKRLGEETTLSTEYRDPSGNWFEARFIVKSKDEKGKLDEVLYVARKINQEKEQEIKQENALRDALLVAKHASRAKTVFLNNMSHDIRTPMNAIIGFTALAETHINSKELVSDYLAKIHTSSTHLLSLINEILDMSRIESGTVKLEENPVHIPDILHDLRTMIQGQVSAKQQNLYIDTLDVVHEDVITDKLRLNQVLLNIVGNAIKYTGIGGDIFIRVSELPCSKEGHTTYRFSVKDNGIGMSPEFKDSVFEAFSRERSSTVSGIQGTGLGMSISKNIVDLMNGEIKVESELGKGSEFIVTITFPLAKKEASYRPIEKLVGARALVVDDDVYTCQSVSKMLREIAMRPDWSTSGKEAVIRAKEASSLKDGYKVVIVDYLMPDMNGIETVRQIRRVVEEDVPIIILSAYDWSEVEEEAKEAGVTAFIAKPIFLSELRSILSEKDENEEKNGEEEQASFEGKRVLLVEDNDLNREIATALLGELGLEVETAKDGIDAVSEVNKAEEGHFDAIFMDIQMPKMDGYTATREIRTLPSNAKANLPIIAMTANAFEEDRQKAFESGMNAHIAKPIDIKQIKVALSRVFAK